MAESDFNQPGQLLLDPNPEQPSTETETPQQTPPVQVPEVVPVQTGHVVEELPAEFLQKFQGKDVNEVLKSHYNLEKKLGEISGEVNKTRQENTYWRQAYQNQMLNQQAQQQPESKPSLIPDKGSDTKYPNKLLSDDDLGFIFEAFDTRDQQKQQQAWARQQVDLTNRKTYAETRWASLNAHLSQDEANQRDYVLQNYLSSNPEKMNEHGHILVYGNAREIDKSLEALSKETEAHERKIVDGIAKRNNIHPDQAKALRDAQIQAATQPGIGTGSGGGVARTKRGTELTPYEQKKYGLLGINPDDDFFTS